MSMLKISQLAGVSKSTVSKAMSDSSEISEETKKKVIKAAKELGMFEKYYKGNFSKKVIAVITPELTSEFYSSSIEYLDKLISQRNAVMTVSLSNFNAKTESELLSFYLTKGRADGIIVLDAFSKIKYNAAVPIAVLNSLKEQKNVDCVNTDFLSPIIEAIHHFKINGHKKIGFVGESLTQDKYEYFIHAMKEHNLEINNDYIIISKYRFETAGFLAMEKLFERKDRPTTILAAYDYIALGIIQSIRSRGFNVPDDFSVIGIDDISLNTYYNISLTSIKSNKTEICDLITELLFKKIENKYYRMIQNITIKGELIIRNSVKKIN